MAIFTRSAEKVQQKHAEVTAKTLCWQIHRLTKIQELTSYGYVHRFLFAEKAGDENICFEQSPNTKYNNLILNLLLLLL